MEYYRQGDILLAPLKELPKEGLKKKRGNILARGEATGHHHAIVAEPESKVQLFEDENGQVYLVIEGRGAILTHQEHKALDILPGIFKVIREREYDPFAEEIRKIRD